MFHRYVLIRVIDGFLNLILGGQFLFYFILNHISDSQLHFSLQNTFIQIYCIYLENFPFDILLFWLW